MVYWSVRVYVWWGNLVEFRYTSREKSMFIMIFSQCEID